MTSRSEHIEALLAAERSAKAKNRVLWLLLASVVLFSLHFVGFFDAERLSEGLPAFGTLGAEMFPPNFENIRNWVWPVVETLFMSIAGTALAIVLSIPLGVAAAANTTPNKMVYWCSRVTLNILRAIPELIMGIIFVAAVGFGSLPGVLALGLHSAGMVGKFIAEAIEHVNDAPVEATKSTGASSFEIIRYAVFPQVVSQTADVCVYRWEYNFRASTVMGMVGAGGIGFELMGSLRIMQYDEVSAILLVILGMVTAIDLLGARIRSHLK